MASIDVPVGLLGYVTVGAAVNRLLVESADDIERATGHRLRVVRALVRDAAKERSFAPDDGVLTTDFAEIANDDSITVVAEVMGGVEPAGAYVSELLRRGKSVVSANKQLVARRGAELFATAWCCRVTCSIPTASTSAGVTREPNATVARIAIFAAASAPSTSSVGSASAYPSRCASASASAYSAPASMRVRMKFVVPFTIPSTRCTFVTTSDSRSTLITGIAAHTDASKRSWTPPSCAAANSSALRRASSCLFAETTGLPARKSDKT